MPQTTPPNHDPSKEPLAQVQSDAPASPAEAATESPTPTPSAQATKSNARSKKSAVTFVIVMGILAVLLLILNLIPFDKLLSEPLEEKDKTPIVTYDPLYFDTPVADEDFTADEDYMALDRHLHYAMLTGETFRVDGDADEYGAICRLFEDFRTAVIDGDCDAYNALFTDEYIEKKGSADFLPQKLYNFRVKVLSTQSLPNGDDNGLYKGAVVTYCQVNYCIKDNNGTFRNDFYRDGDSRTQIFEILDYNGSVKISQISTPTYVTQNDTENEKEGLPIMFYVWIALIVLAVVAEAMTTSLVAIWFVPGAIISMILALLDASVAAQVVTYFVSALVLLIVFKLLNKKFRKKKGYTPTNVDRIIGGKGIVTEEINNIAATGEVKIDGKRWSARTENDSEIIAEGEQVTVVRIEGVKLICACPEKSSANTAD